MMPLLGKSRVDQAGAQNARATLFRPLLPCAPLLAISPYRVEKVENRAIRLRALRGAGRGRMGYKGSVYKQEWLRLRLGLGLGL